MNKETIEDLLSIFAGIFKVDKNLLNAPLFKFIMHGRTEILQFNEIELIDLINHQIKIRKLERILDKSNSTKNITMEILSQLIAFFSIYYISGIFSSKRRYNLELFPSEDNHSQLIYFRWISKDQYFIHQNYSSQEVEQHQSTKIDFFIHKDLKRFFESELDYFVKSEILEFKTSENFDNDSIQLCLMKIEIIQFIANRIIKSLNQFENLQLRLWEKPKFVLKTDYVISLDRLKKLLGGKVFNEILSRILKNRQQMKEWDELFNVKVSTKSAFLEKYNKVGSKLLSLPIDTKYYSEEFKWNLLELLTSNNNLDEELDGVLIKSDNYHALNLIMRKWEEKINLIYIDPPFNTGNNEFPYKNDYRVSTWLTIMYNRLIKAREILNKRGNIFIRIDNTGNHYVRFLLDMVFGKSNFRNEIIINKTRAKKQIKKPFIQQTESLFFYSLGENYFFNQIEIPRKEPEWFELLDFPRSNENPRKIFGKTYYPPKGRRWGLSQERVNLFEQKGKIRINKNKKYIDCFGNLVNEKPELLYNTEHVRNAWLDIPGYSQIHKFSTENSEEMLQRVIEAGSRERDVILDFFLGSGTTTATAHKLNRKWIGVEIGSQFENYILPRMKSVFKGIKTGISKLITTRSSGFIKYHYLEQYIDTIQNFEFEQQQDKKYPIIEKILNPFQFEIKILESGHFKTVNVDLIETFNYILGLFVEKVNIREKSGRSYVFITGKTNKQQMIVVWRSAIEIDYEQDKKFINEYLVDKNYSFVYVNGKCLVENSRSIEIEMKKFMWESAISN
ncbi:MAG: site-specific DNA-methyltransferase [Promethearchaeota archaeon]